MESIGFTCKKFFFVNFQVLQLFILKHVKPSRNSDLRIKMRTAAMCTDKRSIYCFSQTTPSLNNELGEIVGFGTIWSVESTCKLHKNGKNQNLYISKFNSTLSSPSVALLTPCDVGISYRCSKHWWNHLLMITGQCLRRLKWFEISIEEKDTLSFLILKLEFPDGFICLFIRMIHESTTKYGKLHSMDNLPQKKV
jgi:hypothetical protein